MAVLGALALSSQAAVAQEEPLAVNVSGFSADAWPEAQAVVTVVGGDDRPVPDLESTQFTATLDGAPVPVVELTRAEDSSLPVSVVLALDVSGSMAEAEAMDDAILAAKRFLEGLGPEDSVAVLTFNNTVDIVLPLTQDRARASAAIDALVSDGQTALYEATVVSAELAATSGGSRRAVVLLSDGLDNGSSVSREDALASAGAAGLPVFVIGLGDGIDRDYLQSLADASGGRFAETPSPEGLSALYQSFGELLRGQYVLTLDASAQEITTTSPATLRVDVTSDVSSGGAERAICPQSICVALESITQGDEIEGTRTLTADVLAEEPIESVAFLVDGAVVAELSELPFEYTFDADALAAGEHTIAVEARTANDVVMAPAITVQTSAPASPVTDEGGGSGFDPMTIAAAVVVASALGGGLLLFLLIRRRRGGSDEPSESDPEPEPEPSVRRPRSGEHVPLWGDKKEDEPPLPAPVVEEPLGVLRATSGPLAGEAFAVGGAPVSIGCGHRCLIRLPESGEYGEEIAPEHARVWVRGGQLMLHEVRRLAHVGSAGGRWTVLSAGDTFVIGPHTFTFEPETAPSTTPASSTPAASKPKPARRAPKKPQQPAEVPNILRDKPPAAESQAPADSGDGPFPQPSNEGSPLSTPPDGDLRPSAPEVRGLGPGDELGD